MPLKKTKYDRPSYGKPAPVTKTAKIKPAGSVFKSNPVFKGDNSPKTEPKARQGRPE